jgi:hypothetical protein
MSNSSTPEVKREGLDKKVVKLIGYAPTCFFSGAMIGVLTSVIIYLAGYFDFSLNLIDQLDSGYEFLVDYIKILIPPALFAGCFVGLAIGLLAVKIKTKGQRILASSVIGLLVYLLAVSIWRAVTNSSISDSLDYLRFFASQLSLVGIIVGFLVSLLPQPKTQS